MKKREQRNINSMLSYSLSFFFCCFFFKFITGELEIIINKKLNKKTKLHFKNEDFVY